MSWWMGRAAVTEACELTLPDVDKLSPRMLDIDEHGCRSVLLSGPVNKGVDAVRAVAEHHELIWTPDRSWVWSTAGTTTALEFGCSPRPLEWRLAVQVAGIDFSVAFRRALRMWLPRTAVAVDHFHPISLANQVMTETKQNLSHRVKAASAGCREGLGAPHAPAAQRQHP